MLMMFDNSGNRVSEWRLGKKLSLPKAIDAVDITAICAEGLELEFLTTIINGLVFSKKFSTVWWYGADAKTVASILESYKNLDDESSDFLLKKQKIASAKEKLGNAVDKIKEIKFP
jgi:hypothetical protein